MAVLDGARRHRTLVSAMGRDDFGPVGAPFTLPADALTRVPQSLTLPPWLVDDDDTGYLPPASWSLARNAEDADEG